MELHQIECFVYAAETENFTRAAEMMHTSQPALSKSISILENELGIQLFRRIGKKVCVSASGQLLLPSAREMLKQRDRILHLSRHNTLPSTLSIRMTAASSQLPKLLTKLHQEYPEITFFTQQNTGYPDQEADITVYSSLEEKQDAYHQTVLREPLMLAVPSSHRFYDRKSLSLEEIAGTPILSLYQERELRTLEDHCFQKKELTPKRMLECDTPATLRQLLKAEFGIALVPAYTWNLKEESNLRLIPISDCECYRYINVQMNLSHLPTVDQKSLFQFYQDFFQSLSLK